MKKFLINFVASLTAYFIASFIGILAWIGIIWGGYSGWLNNAIGITSDTPYWITALIFYGSFALTTGISVALFFFVGSKLNLLGKHWLNYLSVSGSLIIPIILSLVFLDRSLLLALMLPFVMIWANFVFMEAVDEVYAIPLMYIIATLPSIITWLGMLYKAKKT